MLHSEISKVKDATFEGEKTLLSCTRNENSDNIVPLRRYQRNCAHHKKWHLRSVERYDNYGLRSPLLDQIRSRFSKGESFQNYFIEAKLKQDWEWGHAHSQCFFTETTAYEFDRPVPSGQAKALKLKWTKHFDNLEIR